LVNRFGLPAIGTNNKWTLLEEDDWSDWLREELQNRNPIQFLSYLDGGIYDAEWERHGDPDINDLFRQYVELIPPGIRRVAGAFGSRQWIILAMIRSTPDFQYFLQSELNCTGVGFVATCLALSGAEVLKQAELNTLCQRLMFEPRSNLIDSLVGDAVGTMAINWLRKLDADCCSTLCCDELLALTREPAKSRLIDHISVLTIPIVWWLSRLPAWMCSAKLLYCLAECSERERMIAKMQTLHDVVEAHHPDRKPNIARALRNATDPDHLRRLLDSKLLDLTPFPSPPFQTSENLVPLTSSKLLRAEGLRMRNCIADFSWACLSGSRYFYRWTGPEPATVLVVRDMSDVWKFSGCEGMNGQPLLPNTRSQIIAAVENQLSQDMEGQNDRLHVRP